jgi:hypothetical protein
VVLAVHYYVTTVLTAGHHHITHSSSLLSILDRVSGQRSRRAQPSTPFLSFARQGRKETGLLELRSWLEGLLCGVILLMKRRHSSLTLPAVPRSPATTLHRNLRIPVYLLCTHYYIPVPQAQIADLLKRRPHTTSSLIATRNAPLGVWQLISRGARGIRMNRCMRDSAMLRNKLFSTVVDGGLAAPSHSIQP